MKNLSVLALVASVLVIQSSAFAQMAPPALAGVQALSGVDPALPDTELQVLDATLANASIVAIGETVHGSGGFVSMEDRLVRYLVTEKGFRLLMIEDALLRSKGMNDWLQACRAGTQGESPIQLLYQPIAETQELFTWLCQFNQAHPADPVVYRGMDVYDRPWEWQSSMEQLNQKLAFHFEADLAITLHQCREHDDAAWAKMNAFFAELQANHHTDPVDYNACMGSLDSMRATLVAALADPSFASSRYDLYSFIEMIDSAKGFQGNYNFAYQSFAQQWASRDGAQALNEFNIWHQEGQKKGIIITHSSHASQSASPSDWWGTGLGAVHPNFSFLKAMPGMSGIVKNIAITGYAVAGIKGVNSLATDSASLDLKLHNSGYSVAYVDPNASFITEQGRWFVENENDPTTNNGVSMIPKDNFDAFIFVDSSLQVTPIPTWYSVFYW